MTEEEMVGWYHQPNGHEFEQAPGVGDGQGSLACCTSWVHQGSDITEQQQQHLGVVQFSSAQFSGSVVSDSVNPWTAASVASLSFTISWSLLRLKLPGTHGCLESRLHFSASFA